MRELLFSDNQRTLEHTVTVAVGASIAALEYTVGHLITGGGSIDWSLAYVTVFVRIGWLRQAHNMVTASLNEMNEQPTVWPSTMAELAPAAGNSIAYSVGFVATEYAGQISAILRRYRIPFACLCVHKLTPQLIAPSAESEMAPPQRQSCTRKRWQTACSCISC